MDIRNSLDGLRSLLGVNPAVSSTPQSTSRTSTAGSGLDTDQATLSEAASQVSQAVAGEGVRADKVAMVQAALAAGTYDVPSSAVASKVVDAMLAAGQ